jgi:hypothetical protein
MTRPAHTFARTLKDGIHIVFTNVKFQQHRVAILATVGPYRASNPYSSSSSIEGL